MGGQQYIYDDDDEGMKSGGGRRTYCVGRRGILWPARSCGGGRGSTSSLAPWTGCTASLQRHSCRCRCRCRRRPCLGSPATTTTGPHLSLDLDDMELSPGPSKETPHAGGKRKEPKFPFCSLLFNPVPSPQRPSLSDLPLYVQACPELLHRQAGCRW